MKRAGAVWDDWVDAELVVFVDKMVPMKWGVRLREEGRSNLEPTLIGLREYASDETR